MKKRNSFTGFTVVFLLILVGILPAQKPVTIESLRELPDVSSPVLSPDGKHLLFTVSMVDIDANRSDSGLYVLDLNTLRNTELARNVSDAQWHPGGEAISFRATYSGKYGIYKADLNLRRNGARMEPAVLLAEITNSNHFLGHPTLKNYAWSPDGQWLAYVSADPSSCDERTDPNEPLVVERTLYKSRTAFSDNCLTRIYLTDPVGRPAKTLTPGPYDSHSLTWSPDSRTIAFLSNRTDEPDHNYNNELWTVDIQTGKETRITQTAGTEHDPHWSPTGKWIAYPATVRPVNTKDSPPENTFIYGLDPSSGVRVNLTAALDRRASSPQWHPAGEWLYFQARNEGRTQIYRVKAGEEPQAVVDEPARAGSLQVGADKIVYTLSKAGQPTEIYRANLDGSIPQRITFETESWTKDHQFSEIKDFWTTSHDGVQVQGFVVYPRELPVGRKLPVIHRIHGGPHGMYGYGMDPLNELLAARGYAVVMINPRGSTGYGQDFADGTYQAWGGGDYKDLMAGMDAALEQFDFLDGENMGVTGGSYGGFMTNWVVTQTDRYKGAVTIASVSNLISFYGNSLYQLLIETEFGGLPWDNYSLLWHFSPMAHVKNVTTPTLLLHGENDIDVPITQAEEFYIALRKLGVPTRFVRYPNEGHGVRQPQHREHYYTEIMEWFGKYVPVKP